MPEDLQKRAGTETEQSIRDALRHRARETGRDEPVHLSGETIGLAVALTGISDPARAVDELVQDALNRYARIRVLDRLSRHAAVSDLPEGPLHKSDGSRASSATGEE